MAESVTRDELQRLHNLAVTAAMKQDRSSPGTQTRRVLYERWANAEQKFSAALAAI